MRKKKVQKDNPRAVRQAMMPEGRQGAEPQPVNLEHERLIEWLQTVKFKKTVVGGIDEVQMWKKLEELDQLYDAAIRAERARYNALLDTYKKTSNTLLRKYKQQLAELISEKNKQKAVPGGKEQGDAYRTDI